MRPVVAVVLVVLLAGCLAPVTPAPDADAVVPLAMPADAATVLATTPWKPLACDPGQIAVKSAALPVFPGFRGTEEAVARRLAAAFGDNLTGERRAGGGLEPPSWSTTSGAFLVVTSFEQQGASGIWYQARDRPLPLGGAPEVVATLLDAFGVPPGLVNVTAHPDLPDTDYRFVFQVDALTGANILRNWPGTVHDDEFNVMLGPIVDTRDRAASLPRETLQGIADKAATCFVGNYSQAEQRGTPATAQLVGSALWRGILVEDVAVRFACDQGRCSKENFVLDAGTGAVLTHMRHRDVPYVSDR